MAIMTSPDPAPLPIARLHDGSRRTIVTPLALLLGACASGLYAAQVLHASLPATAITLALSTGWTLLAALTLSVPHRARNLEVIAVTLGAACLLLMLTVAVYAGPLPGWPQDFLMLMPLLYAAAYRYLGSARGLAASGAYLLLALATLLPAALVPGAARVGLDELALHCGRLAVGSLLLLGALHLLTLRLEFDARRRTRTDALTGLPDRTAFHGALDSAVRTGLPFTLLLVDIDDLTRLNAQHGHPAGDELLAQFARRLAAIAPAVTTGRLDGNEFGIIAAPGTATECDSARELRDLLSGVFHLGGHAVFVTCSVAAASFPRHGTSSAALLRAATSTLRLAKRSGKHTALSFEPTPAHHSDPEALHPALHDAVAHNELLLHYQPVHDLRTGEAVSVEALARWYHPTMGSIAPGLFIPLAERSRLIIPLGEWALFEACAQARRWHDAGLPMPVSVNVSAVQLRQTDFVKVVQRALEDSGLQPEQLELEITEREVIGEDDIAQLERLGLLGVRLSLDDFGTGYANLAQLHRLPVHGIKIDRSFVAELHTAQHNAHGHQLIGMIMAIASNLGLQVTVEGIETEEQLRVLRGLGAKRAQGYLLSRPAAPADLTGVLTRTPQLN